MKKNDWKKRDGVVYSTDSSFAYESVHINEEQTIAADKQRLKVSVDRNGRAGKQVTVISGFIGTQADKEAMCKRLKTCCGAGGTVKDGDILIQGDFKEKVLKQLEQEGFKTGKQ